MIFGEFETACMRLPRRFAPRNDMWGSFLTRSRAVARSLAAALSVSKNPVPFRSRRKDKERLFLCGGLERKLPGQLEQGVGQHRLQRQADRFGNVTVKRCDDRVERDQNGNQKNPPLTILFPILWQRLDRRDKMLIMSIIRDKCPANRKGGKRGKREKSRTDHGYGGRLCAVVHRRVHQGRAD